MTRLWTFVEIILGVFAAATLVGWLMFRWGKSIDRMEREPRYRRRWLYYGAAIYGFGMLFGVWQVLTGGAPAIALLGLPMPLLFVWFYLKAAKRIKVPPG